MLAAMGACEHSQSYCTLRLALSVYPFTDDYSDVLKRAFDVGVEKVSKATNNDLL